MWNRKGTNKFCESNGGADWEARIYLWAISDFLIFLGLFTVISFY